MNVFVWIVIFLSISPAFAGDKSSKFQVFQTNYSGEKEKTFSNDTPGVGVEIIASTQNETYNWVSKGRLTTISGSQNFSDGGTTRKSAFTFYQSSFDGGFTFYPLQKKKGTINIFVGASAIISFNYLKLDSTSLTILHPSYQATSFGFGGSAGLEWYLFGSDKYALTAEFGQRYETASLAKQSAFGLGGFTLAIGMGW